MSAPARSATAPINDIDLVISALRMALDPGFVMIGPSRQIFVRPAGAADELGEVVPVVATAVRQLLDSRHLELGVAGAHLVRHGRREGPATRVLVPQPTRHLLRRWAALRPLSSPRAEDKTA